MDIILTPKQYKFLESRDTSTKAKLEEITSYIEKCSTTKKYPDEYRWLQILYIRKELLKKVEINYEKFNYGF